MFWVGLITDDVWFGLNHDMKELENKEFCFLEKNFKEWYIYLKSFKEWLTSFSMLLKIHSENPTFINLHL